MASRAEVEAVIKRGIELHRRRPSEGRYAVTTRCMCTASVLDHDAHVAVEITDMLEEAGAIDA